MKILVINAGSSSMKYQLIDMENEHVIAKGNCERIGIEGGLISYKTDSGVSEKEDCYFPSHTEAFAKVIEVLTSGEGKVIDSVAEISAVGHRVLHGSEVYKQSTLITDKVIDDIESFSDLGPLHNPPQAATMRACRKVLGPDVPMVAVFDTSVVTYLMKKENLSPDEMSNILNKKSGFLGVSGLSSDSRDLVDASHEGNERAILTCDMFRYQIKKTIGAYAAAMGGLDAVLLTGGIGENSDELRVDICEGMEFLGIELDPAKNIQHVREDLRISKDGCRTEVWVIPTNEELAIALDTVELISK